MLISRFTPSVVLLMLMLWRRTLVLPAAYGIAAFERAATVEPDNQRARQLLTVAVRDRAQQMP